MTHVPSAYRPVPDVFVERALHIDGGPRTSAADPDCRLMLVVAAHPEQPCTLTLFERVSLEEKFADADVAIWVRQGLQGGNMTTAIIGS